MPLRTQPCSNDVLSVYSSAHNKQFRRIWRYTRLRNAGPTPSQLYYCNNTHMEVFKLLSQRGKPQPQASSLYCRQYPPRLMALQHSRGKDSCPSHLGNPHLPQHPNAEHTHPTTEMWRPPKLTPFYLLWSLCPGDWHPRQPHWPLFSLKAERGTNPPLLFLS